MWIGGILLAIGAYWGALTFEHRRECWRVRSLAKTTPTRLASMEDRLSELSQPGLIAAHRYTKSYTP